MITVEALSSIEAADTALTITLGDFTTAPVEGDVLVALIGQAQRSGVPTHDDTSLTWIDIATGSGSTIRGTDGASYYKYAIVPSGGAPSTITFTTGAGAAGSVLSGGLVKISGLDTDASPFVLGTSEWTDERNVGPNPDIGSFTVEDGAIAVLFWTWFGVSTTTKTWSPPTGYTHVITEANEDPDFEGATAVAYKIIGTGTSEDPGAGSNTGIGAGAEGHWVGWSFPPAAAGSLTLTLVDAAEVDTAQGVSLDAAGSATISLVDAAGS